MEDYSVIGKRIPRIDGRVKVTGEAKYAADYEMPGMLWCKIARSPHPHAKILNIDTRKAERLPGVKAVVTGKDLNGWKWGWMPKTRDEPPVAVDKVRYLYEAVAAVAAMDEETAYLLTKTFWGQKDTMGKANPWWEAVTPDGLKTLGSKLHPGAVKYYKEAGVPIPDNLL